MASTGDRRHPSTSGLRPSWLEQYCADLDSVDNQQKWMELEGLQEKVEHPQQASADKNLTEGEAKELKRQFLALFANVRDANSTNMLQLQRALSDLGSPRYEQAEDVEQPRNIYYVRTGEDVLPDQFEALSLGKDLRESVRLSGDMLVKLSNNQSVPRDQWCQQKLSEFGIFKIHIQCSCIDMLVATQAVLELLANNNSLGQDVNTFKILADAPFSWHWTAEAAPAIALYCRVVDAATCMQHAQTIADYFHTHHPEIETRAVSWRPPRFNRKISDLVFFGQGNSNTKMAVIRAFPKVAEQWFEEKPTAMQRFRKFTAWRIFLEEDQQKAIKEGLGSCPDGYCTYNKSTIDKFSSELEASEPCEQQPVSFSGRLWRGFSSLVW